MTLEEVKSKLVSDHGWDEKNAGEVLLRVGKMSPDLRKAFEDYLEFGRTQPLEREGYSLEKLITDYGQNPVGAFLTLAWLEVDPEKAKDALGQGFDEVTL